MRLNGSIEKVRKGQKNRTGSFCILSGVFAVGMPHCTGSAPRPVLSMVTSMLNEAFARILDGINLILHSDQSWQYQRMLREKGIRWSVSLKEEWSGQ